MDHIMTVEELLEELKKFNPESKVLMANNAFSPPFSILSVYHNDNKKITWIDIVETKQEDTQ